MFSYLYGNHMARGCFEMLANEVSVAAFVAMIV